MQLEKLDQLVKYMSSHLYTLSQGAGLLAKRNKCTIDDVKLAKRIVRNEMGSIIKKESNVKVPKILIFDIETAPMKAYVWSMWKDSVPLDRVISDWFIICWSAKWLYDNDIMGDCLTSKEALEENDYRVCKSLYDLINEADIVVAHNGDRFDIPKINARFIINGFEPPKPYISVDTCAVAKKQFGFASNKLDALAGYFGFKPKLKTDFNLWKECLYGNQESLSYMLKYNKQDVKLLEEVYLKLRPWMKNHPNYANFLDSKIPLCSKCGSNKLEEIKDKYYYTQVGKYQLYRCKDCGAIVRGRKTLNKEIKTTGAIH